MSDPKKVHVEWEQIRSLLRCMSNEELGSKFRNYLIDSLDQNWEAHPSRDVTGVRRVLLDFKTNCEKGLV